ncbi:MAG: substrate-binding domain-containing protein [Planctomycetota bacterium]
MALAGIALTAGACDMPDPDPRALALTDPPPVIRPQYATIRPATGHIFGLEPAAAPMVETGSAQRALVPESESMVVVVGRNAQESFDDAFEGAYQQTLEGRKVRHVDCTDREAVELLMIGRADFGLIGGTLSQREIHAGLRQTQIGVELFALTVSPTSPVRSLTPDQIRQIFTGQVNDWQQLGFEANPIVAVVPTDRSLLDRAAKVLIPGDKFASTCVRVASERHVADQILQHRGAIGLVRLTDGPREPGQKLVDINWTPPCAAAFGYGTYPYGVPLQLVTSGMPDRVALEFFDFATSEAGRAHLGHLAFQR